MTYEQYAAHMHRIGKPPSPEGPVVTMQALNLLNTWIVLPMPPRISDYWRFPEASDYQSGKRYLTKKARAYRRGLWEKFRALGLTKSIDVGIRVYIKLCFAKKTYGDHIPDLDNRMKSLLDACTFAGVWGDDGLIDVLHIERGEPKPPKGECLIRIELMEKP